ncbi:hypothetical protein V6N13_148043 [Hibiscus sabdariffa]
MGVGSSKGNIETDSINAVRLVQSASGNILVSSLVAYIVSLLHRSWEIHIVHVPCNDNKVVDGLTRIAHTEDLFCHRFFTPSDGFLDLLHVDATG